MKHQCFRIKHIKNINDPGLTWDANHTMHHKLPYKKTTCGDVISFLFYSMVIVWPVNDLNSFLYVDDLNSFL